MAKKLYDEYLKAMGIVPNTKVSNGIGTNLSVNNSATTAIDKYALEAMQQKINAQYAQQQASQTEQAESIQPTQANNVTKVTSTKPSSWAGLKSFLSTNIDAERDWDNEEIRDASILSDAVASKTLSNDQLAEGRILFQNYLSDLQAQETKNQRYSEAENNARVNTAYQNTLAKKIASYLAEAQGNAGLEGYSGVTQGQAINLANMEQSAQQNIQNEKSAAQQSALEAYQQAMLDNSLNYTDQYGTLMASRDEKADADYQNYLLEVESYIESIKTDDAKISQSDYQKAKDYIAGLDTMDSVKTKLSDYIDLSYEKDVISDEENQAAERQKKIAEIEALTYPNEYNTYLSGLTESQKTEYKEALDKKEAQIYPMGRSEYIGYSEYQAAKGTYKFTYNDRTYNVKECIGDDPLGSDTGTITEAEANKWNVTLPSKYKYEDILVIHKDDCDYFYVKRNKKWYYLCNSNWSDKAINQ